MKIAGWVVWTIFAFLTLALPISIRNDVKHGKIVHPATLLQSMLAWILLALFLVYPWSKLHMLWGMPAVFIVSFVTTARLPLVSRIALFLAYFYAGIVCVGCPLPAEGVYVYDPDKRTSSERTFEPARGPDSE